MEQLTDSLPLQLDTVLSWGKFVIWCRDTMWSNVGNTSTTWFSHSLRTQEVDPGVLPSSVSSWLPSVSSHSSLVCLQSIGQWLSSVPDKCCLHEKASPVRDRMAPFGPQGARVVELTCSYGWCRSEGTGWPWPPRGLREKWEFQEKVLKWCPGRIS